MGTSFLTEIWRQYKTINKILIVLCERNISIIVDLGQNNLFSKLTLFLFDKGLNDMIVLGMKKYLGML